jgi:hypothetical protein
MLSGGPCLLFYADPSMRGGARIADCPLSGSEFPYRVSAMESKATPRKLLLSQHRGFEPDIRLLGDNCRWWGSFEFPGRHFYCGKAGSDYI